MAYEMLQQKRHNLLLQKRLFPSPAPAAGNWGSAEEAEMTSSTAPVAVPSAPRSTSSVSVAAVPRSRTSVAAGQTWIQGARVGLDLHPGIRGSLRPVSTPWTKESDEVRSLACHSPCLLRRMFSLFAELTTRPRPCN